MLGYGFLPWDRDKAPSLEDQEALTSFRGVCDEAAKLAEELVGRLKKLKLDADGKIRRLMSLRLAVKGLWSENEVANLTTRLCSLRQTLVSHVLFSIRKVRP